eukprot:m.110918 g.110918  ORF g.110918 m.110918 type:complete len:76 (+) comp16989_c0_seq16:2792-3019(+)
MDTTRSSGNGASDSRAGKNNVLQWYECIVGRVVVVAPNRVHVSPRLLLAIASACRERACVAFDREHGWVGCALLL